MLSSILGKILIAGGIFLITVGIVIYFHEKIPLLGKLPGDIYIKKENFTLYLPLMTCLLISFIISFVVHIFSKH